MKERISIEQSHFIDLLKKSLIKAPMESGSEAVGLSRPQWEKIVHMAKKHAVLPLLYDVLDKDSSFPCDMFTEVQKISRQTVIQNYKLLYVTNYIVKIFEQQDIKVLVLKGPATANLYPVPELRKSGDIDLLVADKSELQRACDIMEQQGFVIHEEQLTNHHLAFESKDGIELELHTMLAEPFDSPWVNQYLTELALEYCRHIRVENLMGSELPVPEDAYHAFHLLIHMLQHYLRSGFGLKLLCDWVVFWNRDIQEQEADKFLSMVSRCGLNGFLERVTAVCVSYLGLEEHRVRFVFTEMLPKEEIENFMLETLEAEEFGTSSLDRMLVLRGTSPIDYIREFHHQMCLNYPNAKRIILIWPVLWMSTLARFLNNNRKIRRISLWAVFRKTNARSKNKEALHLFQKNRRKMNVI